MVLSTTTIKYFDSGLKKKKESTIKCRARTTNGIFRKRGIGGFEFGIAGMILGISAAGSGIAPCLGCVFIKLRRTLAVQKIY